MMKIRSIFLKCLAILSLPTGAFAAWQMPPTQFPGVDYLMTAADNNNHIMLVNNAIEFQFAAYYYTNGAYTLSQVFETGDFVDDFGAAMEPSGTSTVVWHDSSAGTLNSAYFNGSTWSTPSPDPIENLSGLFQNAMAVAMNGPGSALAIWSTGSTIDTSFLTGGTTWSPPITIGGESSEVLEALYSANGTAVALWHDELDPGVHVNNFDGTSWQSEQLLFSGFLGTSSGIDANGNAFISVNNGTSLVVYPFNANTSAIGTPVVIAGVLGIAEFSLYVAPNGTAVIVWQQGSAVLSSIFNGTVWSAPITVTTNGQDPAVGGDTNGNALVIYATGTNGISSQILHAGSTVWSLPEVVTTMTGDVVETTAGLSAGGKGFAAWGEMGEEEPRIFATATVPPTPPTTITGFVCKNTFATQVDRVNVITFTPSTDPGVVSYIVRRNGVVVATIPATGPFTFEDHQRCKNQQDVYTVTAVDVFGVESTPVTFVFN